MSDTRRIAKNTLMLYFRQILIMAVSLYTVRVVLNVLGAEDYGIYNVVAGVVTMFGFLSGAMANASLRYFSVALQKNNREQLKITFNTTFQIYGLIVIIVVFLAETGALYFVNHKLVIAENRIQAANYIFQTSVVSFICTLFTAPYISIVVAHENMRAYSFLSVFEYILRLIFIIALNLLSFDKLIAYGFLRALVSFVILIFYSIFCHIHFCECKFCKIFDFKLFREIFSYSAWNLFGSVASVAKNQGTNILLNLHFGVLVNSARGISSQINVAVSSLLQNFNGAMRPQIIKQYAANKKDETLKLVFNGSKISFILMYVLSLPVLIEMQTILSLWLKNPPENSVVFSRLVIIDALFDSFNPPLNSLVQATGKIKLYQGVIFAILLMTLPVSYIALKIGEKAYFVMIIAIIMTFLSTVFRFFVAKKLIGFSLFLFFQKIVLPQLIIAIFVAAIALFVSGHFATGIARIFITGFVSTLLITLFEFFIGFSKTEKQLVLYKIKNWRNRK